MYHSPNIGFTVPGAGSPAWNARATVVFAAAGSIPVTSTVLPDASSVTSFLVVFPAGMTDVSSFFPHAMCAFRAAAGTTRRAAATQACPVTGTCFCGIADGAAFATPDKERTPMTASTDPTTPILRILNDDMHPPLANMLTPRHGSRPEVA